MAITPPENTPSPPERSRWQFSLRQMFAAVTGVAIVFALAAWGGWIKSDAVIYLSLAVLIGVFLPITRWALSGACATISAFWLALLLGHIFFGLGLGPLRATPESIWIFFLLIVTSSGALRVYTRVSVWSLLVSLVLIEVLIGAVVIYTYGCPTLFQAFAAEHRAGVFQDLCGNFPPLGVHLLIAGPWLSGIVLGTIFLRWRKSGKDRDQPL
jgi:hypothetical protein